MGSFERLGRGAEPMVSVLGSVRIYNGRDLVDCTPRVSGLVAFMALRPGAGPEGVHAALWPMQRPEGATASYNRNKATAEARAVLGESPAGVKLIPDVTGAGYRLDGSVGTDWDLFQKLIGQDLAITSTPRLAAALRLVRGQPFEGVKERWFAWAEVERQEMIAAVCDAAHELANRSLRSGDVQLSRLAATAGRTVDPANEAAWRNAMRAEYVAGNRSFFGKIVNQLKEIGKKYGLAPEPETMGLIDQISDQMNRK